MANINPVRYPGGKGRKSIVDRVLSLYPQDYFFGRVWVESFCGGCGLGLELANRGIVDHALFNDNDPRIAAMWNAIAYRSDELIKRLNDCSIDMKLFWEAKRVANDDTADEFDRGYYTYILNRCCRSGYIDGGVIGGNDQSGTYKIDSRFNRSTLNKKIARVGDMAKCGIIEFSRGDAIKLIGSLIERAQRDDDTLRDSNGKLPFLYVDPPYVKMGQACYRSGVDHRELARVLQLANEAGFEWLVSYDDCDIVRSLYDGYAVDYLHVTYSNNTVTRGKASELLISSNGFVR